MFLYIYISSKMFLKHFVQVRCKWAIKVFLFLWRNISYDTCIFSIVKTFAYWEQLTFANFCKIIDYPHQAKPWTLIHWATLFIYSSKNLGKFLYRNLLRWQLYSALLWKRFLSLSSLSSNPISKALLKFCCPQREKSIKL